tara:strand:+ start:3196 stop:4689 length:1494 start_codon:yes stop_codon:yes gene_type:complete
MANLKFSQFTEQTDTSNVQFIVGYNGATNVRISPDNINGAYLPLAGGTITGPVIFSDNSQLQLGTNNDMRIYHDPSGSGTNIFNSTLGNLKFIQGQDNGLIEFENDNGAGNTESYFILNGSDETIRAYKTLKSGTTNLALEGNNAGFVEIRSANGTTPGTLQLNCEQNSHGIKIQGPPHSAGANYTLVFPTTDGGTGEFLQTNGSGVLTWAAAGTGTVTSVAATHAGNAFTAAIGNVSTVNPSVNITLNGSSSQYIDGAGNLTTFPSGFTSFDITGGSGSAQTITNGNTVTLAQGTGISTVAGATDTVTISNTLPFNSLTLAGDSGASQSITNNNTITLAGGTGLSSVASATDTVTFNANVDGTQSVAANTSTTTAARTYKVQVDSSDNLVVNVPWASGGSYTPQVLTSSATAQKNYLYILTGGSAITLTMPSSPSAGDSVKVSNLTTVDTCVIEQGGSNIMGIGQPMTLDNDDASFELIYTNATQGWVIIGATASA